MRVVHITSGRLFGGIEQMLLTMARYRSVRPDLQPMFAVAAPGRFEQELRALGADVHALGDVRLSRPASVVHARSRLRDVLSNRSDMATVAICHAPWAFALFASTVRRQGVPVVLWQHDRATGRSLVERWARSTPADLVICNSAWTARTAGALQPGGTVAVVHPPVAVPVLPPDARARIRDALDAREDDVVVLSASRFEPWKGHLHLVRALGSLVHLDRWTLWIAGRAERPHERRHEAALRDEVARLGLEARVRFLGERRDVPMLLSGADLLCQSNEGPEPFGVVFAEALLSGVPVVSMDLGGAPEIVGESCGKLVPAGNQEALAGALRELLTDRALRQRLGANGPTHAAARCGPEVVLPQLARALERLGATAAA